MLRLLIALFICSFSIQANAQIVPFVKQTQYLKDERYPNWDNRLTGKLNFEKKGVHHPRKRHYKRSGNNTHAFSATRLAETTTHPFYSKPAGCPSRAWCGCWLSKHLGLNRRDLWLARNWARIGSPSHPAPNTIAVMRHHVGLITAVIGNKIKLLSGNDGNRVRERWRPMAGVIAIRRI